MRPDIQFMLTTSSQILCRVKVLTLHKALILHISCGELLHRRSLLVARSLYCELRNTIPQHDESATRYELQFMRYALRIMCYYVCATRYELCATTIALCTTSYELCATTYALRTTNYLLRLCYALRIMCLALRTTLIAVNIRCGELLFTASNVGLVFC